MFDDRSSFRSSCGGYVRKRRRAGCVRQYGFPGVRGELNAAIPRHGVRSPSPSVDLVSPPHVKPALAVGRGFGLPRKAGRLREEIDIVFCVYIWPKAYFHRSLGHRLPVLFRLFRVFRGSLSSV